MQTLFFYDKPFKIAFWLIVIIESLSFLSHTYSVVNQVLFFTIIAATLIISFWKLEYGFWIICTELFISSFGYLFYFDAFDFRFSIRLGIFFVIFLAWLIKAVHTKQWQFYRSRLRWPFVALLAVLAWGIVNGIINGNPLKDVFFDANAYLYFGIIFVAFSVLNTWSKINTLIQLLFASITAMAIKTIFLLFYFAHQADINSIRLLYTWVRDTRVGEIAPVAQNYYRIFFQGHIWSLFSLILLLLFLILITKNDWLKINYKISWVLTILASLTLIISFSRSIWLSLIVTMFLILFYLVFKEKVKWKRISKISVIIIAVVIAELALITILVNLPLPGGSSDGISAGTLVKERLTTTDEAALGSRFQLFKPLITKFFDNPVIGSGFGTTVTYQTLDPRTKDINGGWYTSYSFEWGYLDIVIKIGLIGLLVYLYFIWLIIKDGIKLLKITKNKEEYLLILGLLFSLIALLITHISTPYINHPLGIFLIIISAAILNTLKVKTLE